MMNLIKNNINLLKYIFFSVLVLAFVIMYYNIKVQANEIKNLNANNAELVSKIEKQNKAIEKLISDVERNVLLVSKNAEKNQEIDIKINKINSKLDSHDVDKIMDKKPNLFINKINKAAKENKRKLMELSK